MGVGFEMIKFLTCFILQAFLELSKLKRNCFIKMLCRMKTQPIWLRTTVMSVQNVC